MDNPAVNYSQYRTDLADLGIRYGEVIAIQHRHIGKFAGLDRSDFVFHAEIPAVTSRKKPQSFLTRDLLIGVHTISERIHTGCGERSEEHTSELQSPDHLVCR